MWWSLNQSTAASLKTQNIILFSYLNSTYMYLAERKRWVKYRAACAAVAAVAAAALHSGWDFPLDVPQSNLAVERVH